MNSTRRYTKEQAQRRREFRIALLRSGQTVKGFAEVLDVVPHTISRAFRHPELVSVKIHSAINDFISKQNGHANA